MPPQAVGGVLGVAKAYTTRVGEGPLPTELHGEMGNRLRESGNEYGASTGRPRRCGWYDAVAVRYAARLNGLQAIALTKLDVLDGLDEIEVAVAYRIGGRVVEEFPAALPPGEACEPVYETWPGWSAPTKGATRFDALPEAARTLRRPARRGERRANRASSPPARTGRRRSSGTIARSRLGSSNETPLAGLETGTRVRVSGRTSDGTDARPTVPGHARRDPLFRARAPSP